MSSPRDDGNVRCSHPARSRPRQAVPRASWGRQDQAVLPGCAYPERVTSPNTLGEFLRARREQVDPRQVGLHVAGVRRTPGLRREEVATLAGVSADYYLRLEQGRDRHPSAAGLTPLAG